MSLGDIIFRVYLIDVVLSENIKLDFQETTILPIKVRYITLKFSDFIYSTGYLKELLKIEKCLLFNTENYQCSYDLKLYLKNDYHVTMKQYLLYDTLYVK